MLAQDVMTHHVECTAPEAFVQSAALKMKQLDIGALPVCQEGNLVGMITDRDISLRAVAAGTDPRSVRVRDIMTTDLFFCYADQPITEIVELMRERQVRRLPVLDRMQKLVGIVSLGDVASTAGDDALTGHALEGISEPPAPLE